MIKGWFIFVLIFTIKCEAWWNEVKGHSIGDYDNGYAGNYPMKTNDFYLCSERKYRVHYSGDDKDIWSEEFSACQPVGVCRNIDGLAINGGKPYACRTRDSWPDEFTFDYNISNSNGGFAGEIGGPIYGILVYGNEYYRSSDTHKDLLCSYEGEVAKRIINNLFGINLTFNYDNETKIEIKNDENIINVTAILLKPYNIKMKGDISIKIVNSGIGQNKYRGIITKSYIGIINEIIEFDFYNVKAIFEDQFKKSMYNGDVEIKFDWIKKKIIIEVGSKIDSQHYCYRGGFRINIYLKEKDSELLKIKNIYKLILRYSGKRITENIKDLLLNFDSFEKFSKLLNYLDIYSDIADEIILFVFLEKYLKNK